MPLSDIVSCPEDQLEEVITHEEPYQLGTWYLAKNIGTIQLCQLGELLGLGTYKALKAGFKLVGEPLPEGPWPETMHQGLIAALAGITDAQIAEVTPRWAKMEEFAGTVPPESLAEYLKGLRAFLSQNSGPFFLVNAL